jgi:hypothetical protein
MGKDLGKEKIVKQLKLLDDWKKGLDEFGRGEHNLLSNIDSFELMGWTFMGQELPDDIKKLSNEVKESFASLDAVIYRKLFGKEKYDELKGFPAPLLAQAVIAGKIPFDKLSEFQARRDRLIETDFAGDRRKIAKKFIELHDKFIRFLNDCLKTP